MRVAVLSGGTGTPKVIEGLEKVIGQDKLSIIVNTSDDFWFYGLYISPDVDTVTYLLSGLLDTDRYWGVRNDTFRCLSALGRYGAFEWFKVGDVDMATHIFRTYLLRRGYTLTGVTKYLSGRLGVKAEVLPMSDDHVETYVLTDEGELHIQEYLVKRRCEPKVFDIRFEGLSEAKATKDVLRALEKCDLILLGPSNPINSIGPILSVRGVRDGVKRARERGVPVIAISPIIGNKPVSGPAHIFMEVMGFEPSPLGIAEMYSDVASALILNVSDAGYSGLIRSRYGMEVYTTNILMNSLEDKVRLAEFVLKVARRPYA